ncbi:MAG: lipid IV(A) 3-deoxy-D-manno-octulosonic acid transferase [Pseudomonadota bacterium]|nr:lipid IV(A) 3-deoxy-D-manno-octulosonic acid transferase [Pseudomonadota bacterium]
MFGSLLRFLYIVSAYLLMPLIVLHLLWRSLANPKYRTRINERFGLYNGDRLSGTIWIHAVSVGEVQACEGLVLELLQDYPNRSLLLTTTTPTGSDRAKILFGQKVEHSYVPFDIPWAVKSFFDRVSPSILIILETELWPNLYHECGKRKIPLVLASARVSPNSINRYRQLVSLFKDTLSNGIVIAAQSQSDANRFLSIGAHPDRTHFTGNIKFDFSLSESLKRLGYELRSLQAPERPVWIAASTHPNEEEIILAAHNEIRKIIPETLLILVPRHPERFSAVASILKRQGEKFITHSSSDVCTTNCGVLLGDTMGELISFYAAADVAFVGGSLVKAGGHNLLEPAALGLPLITGPYNYNSEDIAQMFNECGVNQVVKDKSEIAKVVLELFEDKNLCQNLGDQGRTLIEANKGTLDRLMVLLKPLIDSISLR